MYIFMINRTNRIQFNHITLHFIFLLYFSLFLLKINIIYIFIYSWLNRCTKTIYPSNLCLVLSFTLLALSFWNQKDNTTRLPALASHSANRVLENKLNWLTMTSFTIACCRQLMKRWTTMTTTTTSSGNCGSCGNWQLGTTGGCQVAATGLTNFDCRHRRIT